jgi:hypothetical protein
VLYQLVREHYESFLAYTQAMYTAPLPRYVTDAFERYLGVTDSLGTVEPGKVAVSCAIGIPPATASTYTGVLTSNTFTCEESGTITLANVGMGNTSLIAILGSQYTEAADETLNITCGDPPTATNTAGPQATTAPPVPTALPPTGTGGIDQDGGTSAGIWLAIAGLAAFAVAGLSAFGWRNARSVR